jgi:antitoxin (DNA-binding transcriptional repressor) of toxin-antitoxin stability system
MPAQPEINQRDLRTRSKEIMDAVQAGQAFTVTRDGHQIGRLVPLRRKQRFVTREAFVAMSRTAPDISLDALRADLDAAMDNEFEDPYDR